MCDEYTLFVLAEWLGIYLTIVEGPSSDQSAVLEASFKRFRLQGLAASYHLRCGGRTALAITATIGITCRIRVEVRFPASQLLLRILIDYQGWLT